MPKPTAAELEKEAKRQALEAGLEFYSHKTPAGPPHSAGSSFLSALNRASSSANPSDNDAARLKPPMLAYTADFDEANDLLACLGQGPMGLDLEWNFSPKSGPHRTGVIQICSSTLILILHTSAMAHRLPPLLTTILQDPTIVKTGVAIKNDALKLQKDYAIHTRNLVELSHLAKLAQPSTWAGVNHLISLRDLTRMYLGRRLRKDSVRVSDWETYPLLEEQIEYAASDTFASLEVLRALAAFFPPTQEKGLLQRLDDMGKARTIDLDQALRLSAYDLYLERIELNSAAKQKKNLNAALREIQPQPPAPAPAANAAAASPPSLQAQSESAAPPSKPKRAAPAVKRSSKAEAENGDEDSFLVTRVLLAHDRAMQRWLYASQTLTQVATATNIRVNTVAAYLVRALLEAKDRAWKSDTSTADGGEDRSILDDFSADDRVRLDTELRQAGRKCDVSRLRYRMLARSLGWSEVGGSPTPSPRASPKQQKKFGDSEAKLPAKAEKRAKVARPVVVELSDDEVDVIDTSR